MVASYPFLTKVVLGALEGYCAFSPLLWGIIRGLFGLSLTCRFSPTCSVYTEESIKQYGITGGIRLGVRRIAQCQPWTGII